MSSFERKQPKRLRNNSRGGGNGSGASVDGVCAGSATTAQSDAVAPRPPQLAVRRAMSRFFILQYVFPALAPQLLVAAPKPDYMVGVHFGHHEPDVSMRYRFVAAQTEARAENRTEQPAALHTRVAAPPCKLFVAFSDEDRNSCRLFRTSALLTPELYHPANHAGRAAAAARDSIEAARSIGLEVEEDNFSTFCVSIPWTFDVSCGLTHAEFNRERINRLRQHPGLNFLARLSRCVLSHPWMHDQYIARLEDSMRFEEEVRRAVAARLEHQLNVAVGRWVATSHGGSKAQMAKMYSFSKSLLSRVKSVQSSNKRICPPLDVAVGATVHLDADMPQPRGWAWPWIRYMRAARAGCGWRHVEGDAPDALGYSMRPYLVLRDWGKGQAATSHTEAGGPSGMAYIRAAPPPPVRRPRRQHRGGESDSLRAIASRLFRRAISFLLLHDARRRWPADQSDAYEMWVGSRAFFALADIHVLDLCTMHMHGLTATAIGFHEFRCKGDACRWRMRDYWIPREALSHDNPVRKQWPLETLVQAVTMLPIVENRLLAAAAKYLRAAEVESVPFKSRASAAAQHGFGQMLPQKFDVPASAASSFRDVLFAVIQEQRR